MGNRTASPARCRPPEDRDPPPSPRRRPTIADVARRAGVSAAAVSFAVNDRPGVSPETRERILAAARELGWRPSASARALTEARTRAIGLVLARDAGAARARLVLRALPVRDRARADRGGLRAAAAARARRVGRRAARLRAAGGRGPRGRLPAHRHRGRRPALRAARARRACRSCSPAGRRATCPFPWVETRHGEGMAAPVEHLAELGHERIGFLGGRAEFEHVREREACWRAALAGAGLPVGPVVHGPTSRARRRSRCWPRSPTAVVCASDVAGAGGRAGRARAAGSRCPATCRSPASTTRRWPRSPRPR